MLKTLESQLILLMIVSQVIYGLLIGICILHDGDQISLEKYERILDKYENINAVLITGCFALMKNKRQNNP